MRIRERKKEITPVTKWREKEYDISKFDWGNNFEFPFKFTFEFKL